MFLSGGCNKITLVLARIKAEYIVGSSGIVFWSVRLLPLLQMNARNTGFAHRNLFS